jgi:hypothetical protein
MKITTETILRLDEDERDALKKLLGNLTGAQKSDAGLSTGEQTLISRIYSALPYPDEREET